MSGWIPRGRAHLEAMREEPKGFRDLYWCWIGNEPSFCFYNDDKPYCTECKNEPFEEMHTYIGHVTKPRED